MAKQSDDTTLGRQVDQLVAGMDLASASQEDVAGVAGQIQGLGQGAVERLARGIFRLGPSRREKVAALLACLEGEPAQWAFDELEKLLHSRVLSPMERVWLLTALRRLEEAATGDEAARTTDAGTGPDYGPEGLPADESELLLWRDELASLDPADQEATIASILQRGDPTLLPFVEMVVSLRQPALDAAVACGLGHFATPATLPLLRELLRRPDPAVRKRARQALAALERQGIDTTQLFVAEAEADVPISAAYASRPDSHGWLIVLVARGTAPGRVRYAVVVVDPVEAGIARAWGESGLMQSDLQDRINKLSTGSGQELVRVEPNTAQVLVAEAERYARSQGKELPSDYVVWRRCIGSPTGPAQLPVTFAPACSECGKRIRGGDLKRGAIVLGHVALCATCAGRLRSCPGCGRALHPSFDEFLVRLDGGSGKVQFVCLRCARRR